jgi:enoyl-CoA hydratase/carnithine racemase
VVLTGAGSAFSAGGDATWLHAVATDPVERARSFDEEKRLANGMLACTLPVIAAVNGPAVGLGSTLASMCDIVLMSSDAFFADPHVRLGVAAGDGAVVTWPALMSMLKAKEYLFTGDAIPAQRAVELGLASRVVEPADLMDEAMALASRLADLPSPALRATKQALNMHLQRAAVGILDFACAAESEHFTDPDLLAKLSGGAPARSRPPQ